MEINFRCNSEASFYVNRDYITSAYFEDVRSFPILSAEEEKELVYKMNHGRTNEEKFNAKKKLIESNLRFVISIARKLGTKNSFLDLVNEGNIGLIRAIEKFDVNKGYKLITYAVSWIIAAIQEYQISKERSIIPPNALKLHRMIKNATKQFLRENDRNPTQQEIADIVREKFDFAITNLEDVELSKIISINENYSVLGDGETFEESELYQSKTCSNNVQDDIEKEYIKHKLNFFLNKLTKREKEIVERYYGINGEEESFDMIALDMKIGGERARQICMEAIKKMQKYTKMVENK